MKKGDLIASKMHQFLYGPYEEIDLSPVEVHSGDIGVIVDCNDGPSLSACWKFVALNGTVAIINQTDLEYGFEHIISQRQKGGNC